MKEEIWVDIKDYEGHYQVSNLGRVKSLKGNHKIIQIKSLRRVELCKSNKLKNHYVDILVSDAFLSKDDNNELIHIDGDNANNKADNLKWVKNDYEIWCPIKDYEDLYEISTLGRVKRLKRFVIYKNGHKHTYHEKFLKNTIDITGYPILVLVDMNSNKKKVSIHRLIAEAFLPNPLNLPMVNHKNGNKKDSVLNNLEWCNSRYNQIHASENGLRPKGEDNYNTSLTNEKALEIYELAWNSNLVQRVIGNMYGVTRECVKDIKLGHTFSWLTGHSQYTCPSRENKRSEPLYT